MWDHDATPVHGDLPLQCVAKRGTLARAPVTALTPARLFLSFEGIL